MFDNRNLEKVREENEMFRRIIYNLHQQIDDLRCVIQDLSEQVISLKEIVEYYRIEEEINQI